MLRREHRAGEKLFVNYAGATMAVQDPASGESRQAQLFVAVLGASNYTFAEATWTQGLGDWIGSHIRALEFFGGVPEIVVPNNLRSGVTRSCRYEPGVNFPYEEMAQHYGIAVVPARPRKPRDKAKIEVGVQVVERWILATLRKRIFFSLGSLNEAIAELLGRLNDRPFRKREGSRKTVFESLDRPALRALPANRYQYGDWKRARVNIDYHVEFDHHWYSVPYQLTQQEVEIRATATTLESFTKASALLRTLAHTRHTGTRPFMRIGHAPINGIWNGRPRESSSGPPPSAQRQRGLLSESLPATVILSRVSDPASASFGLVTNIHTRASKPLRAARSRSMSVPIRA